MLGGKHLVLPDVGDNNRVAAGGAVERLDDLRLVELRSRLGVVFGRVLFAPGVDLAGPLPSEIQNTTVMAAGVTTTSKAPDAATALIGFISSPAAAAVLKASGFRPVEKN